MPVTEILELLYLPRSRAKVMESSFQRTGLVSVASFVNQRQPLLNGDGVWPSSEEVPMV